jgi:hypothetical protein
VEESKREKGVEKRARREETVRFDLEQCINLMVLDS